MVAPVAGLQRHVARRRVPEEYVAYAVGVVLGRGRRLENGRLAVEQHELTGAGDDRMVRSAVADADETLRDPVEPDTLVLQVGASDVTDAVGVAGQQVAGRRLEGDHNAIVGGRRVLRRTVTGF